MTENQTMKAVRQQTLGGPEVLQVMAQPVPQPGPSEVLIRTVAAGLSPTDWVHRGNAGFLGDGPRTLGWDVAGVVEAVGLGVTVHRVGDHVFGMLPYPVGHGSAAEFVVSPARAVVPIPEGVEMAAAGAVPLVGLTAWQALVDTAGVAPGKRVLVHAAAGGTGHVAVQIAKAHGAYVIGTASPGNHELVLSLGADEVIDYHDTTLADVVSDIDIVFDNVGGDTPRQSLDITRDGGTIVSIALSSVTMLGEEARARGVRHQPMLVEADGEGMRYLAREMSQGRLRPVIDRTVDMFDIDAVRRAHAYGETGHVAGKVVLTVPGQ